MMQLIATLHGIEPPEAADYGQDIPGLAKGSALLGLLSSGIVIGHLIAFSSAGLFVMLRGSTHLTLGPVILLTVLSILSIVLLSASVFLIWSSRRGKLLMRNRVFAGLHLGGDEEVLDVGCGNGLLLIGAASQLTTGLSIGVDIWRDPTMNTHTHSHNDTHHHNHNDDHDHNHPTGIRGWLSHLLRPHSHDRSDLAADRAFADNEAGIRIVWLALAALSITASLQLAIVFASGSVALLADTAHNIGDGLNSIPLLIAFYLARRLATRRFTYGYGRAEDIAGIFIVLSILGSAGIIFWESFQRFLNPQPLQNIGWIAAAAIIGFLGNEAVAIMQIRVGNRIGSAALIADGLHARTDGLTSLAILVAAGSAWLGFPLIDPLIGLLIGIVILFIGWDATKRIWFRLMDAVEPEVMQKVETAVINHPDVQSIQRLRLRWVGHQLHGDIQISLQPTANANATTIKHEIRQTLDHERLKLTDLVIEWSP